jgi:hypothetical protein
MSVDRFLKLSEGIVNGLTPKGVLFGKADGTIQQDAGIQYDPATKTLSNGVVSQNLTGESIVFVGDSIGAGTGASISANRFSTLLAGYLGLTEDNLCVPGTEVTNALVTIPVKTSTMRYLVIEYGVNDVRDVDVTAEIFNTNYTAALNFAIAQGWTGAEIVLLGISGSSSDVLTDNITAFEGVITSLAATFGTGCALLFNQMQASAFGGFVNITFDGTHPNDFGHLLISYLAANAFPTDYTITDQPLAINGQVFLNKLLFKGFDLLANGALMGIDPQGNVGRVVALPTNTKTTGVFIQDGLIVAKGAVYPDAYSAGDIIMALGAMLHSYGSSEIDGASFELCDTGGHTNFYNRDAAGNYNFYVSGGTVGNKILAFTINADGSITLPTNTRIGGAYNSDDFGRMSFYTNSGDQDYELCHATGQFRWFWGPGDGTLTQIAAIGPNGFTPVGLTSTQRDAIVSPPPGLEIFNTTTNTKNFFNGTEWRQLTDQSV